MELFLEQQQKQILTQRMQLSLRILQMDHLQLTEYLEEVALENPMAELELPQPAPDSDELFRRKLEWLEQMSRREQENTGYYRQEEMDDPITVFAGTWDDVSLVDYLQDQLGDCDVPEALAGVIRFYIGHIDENGYLPCDILELAVREGAGPSLAQNALRQLQQLDPPGVGARNLAECLWLQLPEEQALARELVADHLALVAQNKFNKLGKLLGVPVEEIRKAVHTIRRLTPKPGSVFRGGQPLSYITPDLLVTSFEDRYHVLLCDFAVPKLYASEEYLRMLDEIEDQETRVYLRKKNTQISWLQKCVEERGNTLLQVARAVVRRQERFFRSGPQHLGVLRMRDIAEMLDLHESTVSRAVQDKYLQCVHGIYPLRHFFVGGVEQTGEGESISAHSVKERLRDFIEGEDPAKPLSDQKLVALLGEDGISISRRTVAKYRDAMGIDGSFRRAVR